MNAVHVLNDVASQWMAWCVSSLWDGGIALAAAGLLWLLLGKKLPHRLGAWMFTLVLLKCVIAMPVHLPVLQPMLPKPDTLATLTGTPAGSLESLPIVTVAIQMQSTQLTWASWLFLIWSLGVLTGIARSIRIWLRTRQLIRDSTQVDADSIDGLSLLLARSGYAGLITVCLSSRLHSPAITGWLRPTLMLPAGLQEQLHPAQFHWMLAHELAHLRNHDVLWQCIESLVRTVLWFHPAVWLASAQSERLRERACDESALLLSGASRQASAAGFVSLIEWSQQRPAMALAGIGMGRAGREARARIRELMRGPAVPMRRAWQIAIVLVFAAVALPSFRAVQAQAPAGDKARISELEQRVADLEQKLKEKSRLDTLRENAIRRAHQRAEADTITFTAEQVREIEKLYQDAKRGTTAAELAEGFQPLLDKYPAANRTGCAVLLLARATTGSERAALLQRAAKDHSDAHFLDATSVGGVARLMLAKEADAAGQPAEAARWRDEIRKDYAEDLDFGAVPLVDILDVSVTPK